MKLFVCGRFVCLKFSLAEYIEESMKIYGVNYNIV